MSEREAGDSSPSQTESVSFGEFSFHLGREFLYHEDHTIMLPPRTIKVLKMLIERPRDVITREEFLDQVWQGAHVTESSLTEAITQLRKALRDDPAEPRYIQTIHRRGYRFIAPVEAAPQDALPPPPDASSMVGSSVESAGAAADSGRALRWLLAIAAAAAIAVITYVLL